MDQSKLFKFSSLIFILIFTSGVFAMSIADFGKVCLFSAISGTITLDGKPAAGAVLTRTADRDGPKTDTTTTDENGYFSFPAIFERTITKHLPMEFVASQEITVRYQENEYEMWSGVKRRREENAEARGQSLIVACELNSDQKFIKVGGSPIHSLCRWNVEPDPVVDWNKESFFDDSVK